jgi:HPt (histidine-containing phosphotransfer) domain-containing protein
MFATIAKWIKPKSVNSAIKCEAADVSQTDATGQNSLQTIAQPFTALATLPGIDVAAGMATTMGNEKLYARLLLKFRDSQGNFAELFASAQTDADPVAPTRAAHTLKGTAGNIGAKGVQAAAAELERALIDNAATVHITGLLQKTLNELAPVISGLQTLVPDPAATSSANSGAVAGPAPAVDPAQLQSALTRVIRLLKDSDSDAAEAVEELQALAKGTPLAFTLNRVAKAVADFDFDEALCQLESH